MSQIGHMKRQAILRLVAQGYMDKQIAHKLNIGCTQVKYHLRAVSERYKKRLNRTAIAMIWLNSLSDHEALRFLREFKRNIP